MIKRIAITLLLVVMITTSAYAVNVVDTLLCKKVFLNYNHTYILVNRLTGEVKYLLMGNGQWMSLMGVLKNQYQAMYNAQVNLQKR
jgi:hypothetical protein